jgi:hypothetical protein
MPHDGLNSLDIYFPLGIEIESMQRTSNSRALADEHSLNLLHLAAQMRCESRINATQRAGLVRYIRRIHSFDDSLEL